MAPSGSSPSCTAFVSTMFGSQVESPGMYVTMISARPNNPMNGSTDR